MKVYSELVVAFMENLASAPSAGLTEGRFYQNTTSHEAFVHNGTAFKAICYADLTNLSGTVPLNKGGTGQTTKQPAFDALSPLTTKGDILCYSTVGTRLGVGTDGYALTASSAAATGLAWAAVLTNPMDSEGDMIYGGASGAATKLDAGTSGQWLISGGAGAPSWSDSTTRAKSIVVSGYGLRLSSNATDNASKLASIVSYAYDADVNATLVGGEFDATNNSVFVGGGLTSQKAATRIQLYTAANNATDTGTMRFQVDSNGDVEIGTTTGNAHIDATAGAVASPTYSFIGDGDTGMLRVEANTIGFATAGVMRMTFSQANVAMIGTSTTGLNTSILGYSSDATTWRWSIGKVSNGLFDGTTLGIGTSDGTDIQFATNNTERMRYYDSLTLFRVNGAINTGDGSQDIAPSSTATLFTITAPHSEAYLVYATAGATSDMVAAGIIITGESSTEAKFVSLISTPMLTLSRSGYALQATTGATGSTRTVKYKVLRWAK